MALLYLYEVLIKGLHLLVFAIEFSIGSTCARSKCCTKESKRSLCHESLLYCIDWTFIKQIFDFTACDHSSLNLTKQKEKTTTWTVSRNKNNDNFLRKGTVWCPLSVPVSDQFYIKPIVLKSCFSISEILNKIFRKNPAELLSFRIKVSALFAWQAVAQAFASF